MALHVEHRYGCGKFIARGVVVTNDDINAFGGSVCDFLHRLDTAVEGDDERATLLCGVVNTLL